MSTARFLPADGEKLEDFYWAFSPDHYKAPPNSQCRFMWFHVSKAAGQSLIHAKTPWELCVALGHAMLGEHQLRLQVSQFLTCQQAGCR